MYHGKSVSVTYTKCTDRLLEQLDLGNVCISLFLPTTLCKDWAPNEFPTPTQRTPPCDGCPSTCRGFDRKKMARDPHDPPRQTATAMRRVARDGGATDRDGGATDRDPPATAARQTATAA